MNLIIIGSGSVLYKDILKNNKNKFNIVQEFKSSNFMDKKLSVSDLMDFKKSTVIVFSIPPKTQTEVFYTNLCNKLNSINTLGVIFTMSSSTLHGEKNNSDYNLGFKPKHADPYALQKTNQEKIIMDNIKVKTSLLYISNITDTTEWKELQKKEILTAIDCPILTTTTTDIVKEILSLNDTGSDIYRKAIYTTPLLKMSDVLNIRIDKKHNYTNLPIYNRKKTACGNKLFKIALSIASVFTKIFEPKSKVLNVYYHHLMHTQYKVFK